MAEKTYREAIIEAMAEEMRRDERVVLIGEDVGRFGGAMGASKGLFQEFGSDRVIDTPISEAAIIGSGLGMALTGQRPIAELMFIDFSGVCMDQILNQVAKVRYMLGGQVKVPLVIRTQAGAGKGYAAQHSQSLEAWFTHVPGLKVVMPATPRDAKGLLKSAIRDDNPVMFIEHKLLYNTKGEVPEDPDFLIPLGVAEVKREGSDLTIVSHSRQVLNCLEAAGELSRQGIEAEVIDLRTLRPMDFEAVKASVEKTGRLVSVEEGYPQCGIGAEVVARVAEHCMDSLDMPPIRIASKDSPIPFARILEQETLPSPRRIVERILAARKWTRHSQDSRLAV
ncbi:MAG: alpha-ketoacid dehydrogenase subunit beta [Acidobacteriia bacterium]|nr:alpha-ketoacid dehydrogenase subunit beta [Terriglobia bacterium]